MRRSSEPPVGGGGVETRGRRRTRDLLGRPLGQRRQRDSIARSASTPLAISSLYARSPRAARARRRCPFRAAASTGNLAAERARTSASTQAWRDSRNAIQGGEERVPASALRVGTVLPLGGDAVEAPPAGAGFSTQRPWIRPRRSRPVEPSGSSDATWNLSAPADRSSISLAIVASAWRSRCSRQRASHGTSALRTHAAHPIVGHMWAAYVSGLHMPTSTGGCWHCAPLPTHSRNRSPSRPLQSPVAARRWRHGRGVSGARHAARSRRRHQDPARGVRG